MSTNASMIYLPSDFEDWLWRRKKPNQPGQPVDFRNQATFPGFNDLPHENHHDPEFYAIIDEFTYRPRRHWLFLAEIVDFGTLLRLQMTIKDVDGIMVPLFFHTEGRGSELEPSLVQKGYTIAILHAEFHAFAFSEPGIRLEEPTNIKIFPLSLDNLPALSDRIQKFSTEINGTRICHGCAKQAAFLKKSVPGARFSGIVTERVVNLSLLLFDLDTLLTLLHLRPARALVEMRKATKQTASFSKTLI